jgi:hypothetical protein
MADRQQALAADLARDLGCAPETAHKHASYMLDHYDLAPKGALKEFIAGIAKLAREGYAKIAIVLLALALSASSACALTGGARHRAVVIDTGLYTAIAAVDDVEMSLSQSGQITAAQHAKLNPQILAMLKAGQAANRAIQVWPQGSPAPRELAAAVVELGRVADSVIVTLPDGSTKSKLQSAVMTAQRVASLLLALSPLLPGGTAQGTPLLVPPEWARSIGGVS